MSDEPHLRQRLAELERERRSIDAALSRLSPEGELPGLFLQLDAGPWSTLLSASFVAELLRLVAVAPRPDSPRWLTGSFVHRGRATHAVDLARLLGEEREPPVDAHMVVLASSTPVALIVDRVGDLLEAPKRSSDGLPASDATAWERAGITQGVCRRGHRLVPLLAVDRLAARVREVLQ